MSGLHKQYDMEREMAQQLFRAGKLKRQDLYREIYEKLHLEHPEHGTGRNPREEQEAVGLQMAVLNPYLREETRFLEVGSGNGLFVRQVAERVAKAYAVEVSEVFFEGLSQCENLETVVSTHPPYDLAEASIDLAFSCHMVEHLHPDDAEDHVAEIHRLLVPGGRYICVTPNRLWGPHDVSRHLCKHAQGLHMFEYTHRDLLRLLQRHGFRDVRVISRTPNGWGEQDVSRHTRWEVVLEGLPRQVRLALLQALSRGKQRPLRTLEQIIAVATRPR